jgi:hygromycin-B 7''-O-kinase
LTDNLDLTILETLEGYRVHFMDPALWTPHVQTVMRDCFSTVGNEITPGLAGTFPTFTVDRQWVVKFFGRMFEGWQSWQVESAAAQLLQEYPVFPTPRLLAQGDLESSATWPYLVFEFIPGVRIAEKMPQCSRHEKMKFAFQLGEQVNALHQIPVPETLAHAIPSQQNLYRQAKAACVQNHRRQGALPEHLIQQIPAFLEHVEALDGPTASEYLVHADLTGDHFLGDIEHGRWQTRAVIDFGDAMLGSFEYELVALHLDLFQLDPGMMKAFLTGYGLPAGELTSLPYRALRATLLHQFEVLSIVPAQLLNQKSLADLALAMWRIE